MKFNNKSTLVKVIAHAEGYSGSQAYGECYMPYEIYEANQDKIVNMIIIVDDLDGEYSLARCSIEVEIYKLNKLLAKGPTDPANINNMMEIDELLYESLAALLSGKPCPVYWPKFLKLQEFTTKVNDFITPQTIELTLDRDTLINGFLIEAGSVINITKKENSNAENILECDVSELYTDKEGE